MANKSDNTPRTALSIQEVQTGDPPITRNSNLRPQGTLLDTAMRAATLERIGNERGFDAIIVGAGAAGGMAAKQLTQAGMEVLSLDAGWRSTFLDSPVRASIATLVEFIADPRLQSMLSMTSLGFGRRVLQLAGKIHQPMQTKCFAWVMAPSLFVNDRENPYFQEPGSQFHWFRGHQLGGRMIIPGHGWQYYRFSRGDFEPQDGLSSPWPLLPGELDPWYETVERELGLSGAYENCPWVPDGYMSTVREPSPAEAEVCVAVKGRWPGTWPVLGRWAPPPRNLESAAGTSRLFLRAGAIVSDVQVDSSGQTTGVRWYDRATKDIQVARAPIVFLCASTLETTRILLCSQSPAFPKGIGAASGMLGRCLMDHVLVSAEGSGGSLPGEPVANESGRCVYLPRFDLRHGNVANGRGYGIQVYRWSTGRGRSAFTAVAFAEMTPRTENNVALDPQRRSAWGQPALRIACRHNSADMKVATEQSTALQELAGLLNVRLHRLDSKPGPPGTAIHECGTARMGDDPTNSVVDPYNQCWDAKGLYVTDASCFASQGTQNPTLTILALTARACNRVSSTHRGAEPAIRGETASAAPRQPVLMKAG